MTTRERLKHAVIDHPDRCASDHATALGVSRERIRQLLAAERLPVPCGHLRRRRQPHTQQKLDAMRDLILGTPQLIDRRHVSDRLQMSDTIVREYLHTEAPDLLAVLRARKAEARTKTKCARVKAALVADPTTPLSWLARQLDIPVAEFNVIARRVNLQADGALSARRLDGRTERARERQLARHAARTASV